MVSINRSWAGSLHYLEKDSFQDHSGMAFNTQICLVERLKLLERHPGVNAICFWWIWPILKSFCKKAVKEIHKMKDQMLPWWSKSVLVTWLCLWIPKIYLSLGDIQRTFEVHLPMQLVLPICTGYIFPGRLTNHTACSSRYLESRTFKSSSALSCINIRDLIKGAILRRVSQRSPRVTWGVIPMICTLRRKSVMQVLHPDSTPFGPPQSRPLPMFSPEYCPFLVPCHFSWISV